MDFKKRKQIVQKETQKLYDKYNKKGLLSIYWYGSGLINDDFNENSDIDLVAISKDKLDMKYEKEMISILQQQTKLDIRIRILYLSELNDGKILGFLAKVLPIKLWLINFKNYIHLNGEKFNQTDFKVKKANFVEATNIELQMYVEKKEDFRNNNNNFTMYLIKSAIYYFYYLSCQKKGYFDFSYNNISEDILEKYKEITNKLISIKNNNYDIKQTKKVIPILDKLILLDSEKHLLTRPNKEIYSIKKIEKLRNKAIEKIKLKLEIENKEILKIILIGSSIKYTFGKYADPGFRGSLYSDFDFIVFVEDDYKIPNWLERELDGKPFPNMELNLAYRSRNFLENKYDVEVFFIRKKNADNSKIQKLGELAGIPMSNKSKHKYLEIYSK